MNEAQRNAVGFAFTTTCGIVLAVGSIRMIRRTHAIQRKTIDRETALDVLAIAEACDFVTEKINNGEIRSLEQLRETFLTQVAFYKIAVREDT